MTEVVIGGRHWAAREESGSKGVAEEGRDGTGIAIIVPFWRNGASQRSQLKDIILSIKLEAARQLWRTMKSWMSKGVTGRDNGRLRKGAVAVKPTAHATGKTVREWIK